MNKDLKVCGIYGIFDTLTGECLYVGQSKNIHERRQSHFKRLRGERYLKSFTEWFVSIGKDESRLDLRVLCRCLDNDDVKNKLEIFWFNELHPRFYGAVPSINNRWSHSEETRKKIGVRTYESERCGKHYTCAVYYYTCVVCNKFFSSPRSKRGKHALCSKECMRVHHLKMDTLDYNKVKDLYESGVTQVKIAKTFGVSNATVSKFMRDNGISTGYKRHDPGLKRKSRKTSNADVV
jgi:GIY-YIG catalytic domain protein